MTTTLQTPNRTGLNPGHEFEALMSRLDEITDLLKANGERSVDSYHRELGQILWEYCGMACNAAGLKKALEAIPSLEEEFWRNVSVPGRTDDLNQELEKAQRLIDFLELGKLIAEDALHREESCGGHFREEHETEDNEAKRDDENFSYVAAWEYRGPGNPPKLNKESLNFEYLKPSQRSYK